MSEPSQSPPQEERAEAGVGPVRAARAGESAPAAALPAPAPAPRLVRLPSAGAHPQRRQAGAMMPAVQAAAVAAGSFVAGAAVAGLLHRRPRRAPAAAPGRRAGRGAGGARGGGRSRRSLRGGPARTVELVQIVGSRSLLVDVHLLGGAGDR